MDHLTSGPFERPHTQCNTLPDSFIVGVEIKPRLKALSHLDDLANVCRFIKKFPNTFVHVKYAIKYVSFAYV